MKEFELPDFAKGGKPIETANPYPEIRKNAELNREWDYSGEVAWLNRKFDQFKARFFDGLLATGRPPLPVHHRHRKSSQ